MTYSPDSLTESEKRPCPSPLRAYGAESAARDRMRQRLARLVEARQWTIYAAGCGLGWMAWNRRDNSRVHLSAGSFADAVAQFEKLFGPYYPTR